MTAASAYRTRLEVLFAWTAPRAVILRRGPRRHFHLISWDLARDEFEHGQWLKGHVRLCDLSPEGDRLLYWAHQYHASAVWRRHAEEASRQGPAGYDPLCQPNRSRSARRRERRRGVARYLREAAADRREPRRNQGVWTALSRPPYFSALALWPGFGHWTGGGHFLSRDVVALNESTDGLTPKICVPPPPEFRIRQANADGVARPICQSVGEDWGQASPEHACAARSAGVRPIVDGLREGGAHWVEFVSPRPGGDLLFGCDGAIYRLGDWRSVAPPERLAAARRLIDLTSLSFTRRPPPPEALEW